MNERSLARRGVRSVLLALRLRGPLSADPTAQILHALVLALTIWSAIWTIFTLPLYPNLMARLVRLRFIMVADLVPVTTLILLRLGHFRQATYVYLTGQWAQATYNIAINGSIEITSTAFYITLPILATWLLGFREAFWTAGVCLGSALILALRQGPTSVFLPTAPLRPPLLIWANLVQLTLTAAAPVAHILQTLQQYKEHLEQVVEQRTAELVIARDQADSANRAKSTFLANMSHELRTPLSVILASSDLLNESDPTPDQREDIDRISHSGKHLLGLIDNVLDVAKIESGKQELAIAASDLLSTVRMVIEMMRGRAEDKHLALIYYQAPDVPRYVRVDAPKLRQILINLLGNAIKFTREGAVELRLSAKPGDEPGYAQFCFDINDTGVGMPQHDLDRIFEPFQQVGNPSQQAGTGLGLTITRRFVELMGGTLLVESEVGRGSCFVVKLPLELARASETYGVELAAGYPFILESGQPDWRVLIVEDDPESATVLQKMLTRAGFQVRVAENGVLAVEAFQHWQPHFIWMDLGLPQLSGTEATRRIRQLDGGAETKIAAITAAADASGYDGMRCAGFDDIAFKPFRQTEIFFCMARHLGVCYSSSEGEGKNSHQQAGGRPS
uniref:histidine kinase n=1 Tax=Solibacter usitatus (strain Ellin6076) TaxID=234267 RepID=Q01TN0_SOLUE